MVRPEMMRNAQLTFLASLIWLGGLTSAYAARAVDQKRCRALMQNYEQIERGANTLQVNNYLFAAARRGCKELAQRVLANGGSLRAPERTAAAPPGAS